MRILALRKRKERRQKNFLLPYLVLDLEPGRGRGAASDDAALLQELRKWSRES